MIKIISIFFFVIVALNQCGFSPIYLEISNDDLYIEKVEFEGDKTINYLYKTYFNNFKNVNNEKKYKIKVNTNYKKTPYTRDKTAKVINYELIAETSFEIILNNKIIKTLKFSAKQNIDNSDDELEEQKYETVVKQNFASTIFNEFITQMLVLDDN